jgi:hypothetical protein
MRCVALTAIGICCALLLPAPALAGAPNYDCVAGDAHISVDQYVDLVAASGREGGPVVWGAANAVYHGGGSLDFAATFGGTSWSVAIRAVGKSLVLTSPGARLTGHCKLVPGNFALRKADGGGSVLRADSSGQARRILRIPAGTPIWERPDVARKGDWLAVDRYVAHAGSLAIYRGWLRQLKPSVLR